MKRTVRKDLKMPKWLADMIVKQAQAESSSFSQFMRTAALNELKRKRAA